MFNKFINSDLLQSTLHVTFTEGFFEFVDDNSSILKNIYAVNDTNDILHIKANKGVRLFVRLIKQAIFRAKTFNKTVDQRTYANVTRGGPIAPIKLLMMTNNVNKELCDCCRGFILIGQRYLLCENCKKNST